MRYVPRRTFILLLFAVLVLAGLPTSSRAQEPANLDYLLPPQPGFPVSLPGSGVMFASPTLADLDDNGQRETIIIGTDDGWVHAIRANGTVLWSHNTGPDFHAREPACRNAYTRIRSAPAVADLDGDGTQEVIVTVGDIPELHTSGGLIVLRSADGSVYPGWPYLTKDYFGQDGNPALYPDGCADGFVTSPAVADLDGDGRLEIIAGATDMHVYAWRLDGTLLPGWPRVTHDTIWSSPAVADLDNDGWPEVIIGSDSHTDSYFSSYNGGALWLFRRDGSSLPGTPCYFDPGTPSNVNHTIQSSPAVADLDSDGYLDVIIGTGPQIGGSSTPPRLYAFSGYALTHNSCANVPGWPVATNGYVASAPAVGDLEGNGSRDVVASTLEGWLYAWRPNGSLLNGFPMRPADYTGNLAGPSLNSPILGDLDGNGRQDIFFSFFWEVGIVRDNGRQHTSPGPWPDPYRPTLLTDWTINGVPAVGNTDSDSSLEVFIGGTANGGNGARLYAWQISTTHTLNWPMFRQNPLHTAMVFTGGNDATLVSHTLPATMPPGSNQGVRVVMKNTGTSTWTPGNYRLCASTGNTFGVTCVDLTQSVAPGATVTFNFTLTAPATLGFYTNTWRMRQGSSGWFGDSAGDQTVVGNQPALYVLTTDPNRNGTIVYRGGIAPDLGQPHDRGTPPCTEYTVHVAPQAFQLTTNRRGYYMVFANDRVCWGGEALDVGGVAWPLEPRTIQDIAVWPGMVTYVTLDADGELRYASVPPPISLITTAPAPCGSMQTARSVALTPDGRGLYVMDARGCIYRSDRAPELPRLSNVPFADNSARKLKLTPSGTGYYILDQYGRVWNGGDAPALAPRYSIASSDWARDFELTSGGRGYYLLAKDGSIWTGGAAPALTFNPPPTWPGQDVARDLALAYSVEEFGLAVPPPASLALMRDPHGNTSGSVTLHLEGAGGQTMSWQASLSPNVSWLRLNAQSGTTPFDLVLSHGNLPSCSNPPCTFSTTLNLTVTDGYGQQYNYSTAITLYVVEQMWRLFLPVASR